LRAGPAVLELVEQGVVEEIIYTGLEKRQGEA